MTRSLAIALIATIAVAAGRFTVPGHGLTGWPGLYESLAHAWVGAMGLALWQERGELSWGVRRWFTPTGWALLCMLVAATALETVMFLWGRA